MVNIYSPQGLKYQKQRMQDMLKILAEKQKASGVAIDTGGGWHDNAGYEGLRVEIESISRRLSDLNAELSGAEVRRYPKEIRGVVEYGTKVRFKRDNRDITFCIVGWGDEDIDRDRVRYDSPIAQVLLDREVGETFGAEIRDKSYKFQILGIEALVESDLERSEETDNLLTS